MLARPGARAAPALALALSLAVHAGAAALLAGALARPGAARVDLVVLDPGAWARNRGPAAETPRARPALPASPLPGPPRTAMPAPEAPDPRGTVVDVVPAPDRRRSEAARFLADEDAVAARETRAPVPAGPAPDALAPRFTPGEAGQGAIAAPGEGGDAAEPAPGAEGAPGAPAEGDAVAAARRLLAAAGEGGEGGARREGAWDPRLLPASTTYRAAGGGAPRAMPSWLEEGSETWVSTRKFRHAGFYRRVADSIRGQWDPNRAWDARDPHDRVLGRSRRITVLEIVLLPDGRLEQVSVTRPSGVAFLDEECLRAVRAVGRFPNPPAALVGPGGRVVLADWEMSFAFRSGSALDPVLGFRPRPIEGP